VPLLLRLEEGRFQLALLAGVCGADGVTWGIPRLPVFCMTAGVDCGSTMAVERCPRKAVCTAGGLPAEAPLLL
jgi:hypothetical protein